MTAMLSADPSSFRQAAAGSSVRPCPPPATIPLGPAPRPLPPLDNYDGVSVFARTWGIVRFYRASFSVMYASPAKHGWKQAHRDISNVWTHPLLPGYVVARDFERYGWLIAQRFPTTPDIAMLDRIADVLVGGGAPTTEVALPLRLRLPVRGGYAPVSPGSARCRPLRDAPAFTLETSGVISHISLVESTERKPRKLWVQTLVGGVFTTAEGLARRALYPPDFRHLNGLHQSSVVDALGRVVDSMVMVCDYFQRHLHVAPDAGAVSQDHRFANFQQDPHSGKLHINIRLRYPASTRTLIY